MVAPLTYPTTRPFGIFCLYSQEDEKIFANIEKRMHVMQRRGLFHSWHACTLDTDTQHITDIERLCSTASLIILLISPAFLQTNTRYVEVVEHALAQQAAGQARVFPILLQLISLDSTPLAHLASAFQLTLPATNRGRTRDESCFAICVDIRGIIEMMKGSANNTLAETSTEPSLQAEASLLWHVPYQQNPFFTGRGEILQQVHNNLMLQQETTWSKMRQSIALCGPTGYGKTQIALAYAYQARNHYSAVIWVNAESYQSLLLSYEAIAQVLKIPVSGVHDQYAIAMAVKEWLNTHNNWLLILDNIHTLDITHNLLPVVCQGSILLTTIVYDLVTTECSIPVEEMTPEEGALLLLRHATILSLNASMEALSSSTMNDALGLTYFLKGHPTALTLAGTFTAETGGNIAKYYRRYRQQQKKLIKDHFETVGFNINIVDTVCSLSIAQITTPALDILRVCAFLPVTEIPLDLFSCKHYRLNFGLYVISDNPIAFEEATEMLRAYALIQLNNNRTFSLTPLAQRLILAELSEPHQKLWAEQTVYMVNMAFPQTYEQAMWASCNRTLLSVLTCAKAISQFSINFSEASSVLNRAAQYLQMRGQSTQT